MKPKRLARISFLSLVLTLVCNLGPSNAGAQGGVTLVAVIESGVSNPTHYAVDSSGRLFGLDTSSMPSWRLLGQVPSGRPVSLSPGPYFNKYVIATENGDVYTFPVQDSPSPTPVQVTLQGNVFSGTVQVEAQRWSKFKEQYR